MESPEASHLKQVMGAGAADIAEILPELSTKLDGLEKPSALDPEQARFRLIFSIASFLKNIGRAQPLVVVLDDLHWADESSLLLLELLAQEISASSVMVLGTYRDNEVGGDHPLAQTLGSLVREENSHRMTLEGFSLREVSEFVEARAGIAVTQAAAESLHERTEGNPLFVGEVVSSVSPEDMARDQSWVANIPKAVREAILQRVSRLSETCNQMLRTASVIGRNFDLSLLRALSPEIVEGEFLEGWDEALGIRIIESVPESPGGYRFSHALIQQAIYEEIPPMRRAQSHGAAGETLERMHVNDLDQHAAELALHFGEATPVLGLEKLVHYSLMAGELALASYAYEEASVHFQAGLTAQSGQPTDDALVWAGPLPSGHPAAIATSGGGGKPEKSL